MCFKKFWLIVLLSITSNHVWSKSDAIDVRGACYPENDAEGISEFLVTFNATPVSLKRNSPGHAYVVLSAPINAFERRCERADGFGHNPKSKSLTSLVDVNVTIAEGVKFAITEGGVVNEDLASLDPSYSLSTRVSSEQYNKIKWLIETWRRKDYVLTQSDCITFIIEVAEILQRVKIPERKINQFPADYLKSLIDANKAEK